MASYHPAADVADALDVLAAGDGARLLLGGTDLLVALGDRSIDPTVLVDLKTAHDLPAPIVVSQDAVTVGPTATMSAIAHDATIGASFPGLVEAAASVGSIAIRNRATLVGNLCHASPAADTAPVLLALRAEVTIAGAKGNRTVPLDDFFLGPRSTLCGPTELVLSVRIPTPPHGSSTAFARMTRRRGVDLASVSVAALVDATDRIRLGLGAVGPRPLLSETSDPIDLSDEDEVTATIEQLVQPATPITDIRAGADYRAAMVRVLAGRTVRTAAERRS